VYALWSNFVAVGEVEVIHQLRLKNFRMKVRLGAANALSRANRIEQACLLGNVTSSLPL
jgi:hypothetical protein